ncbi:uncharacterized protein LOC133883484 [Phragmites australis]|uniref:uncharacterized protein LOC133883484 n=1 Tax=Phragmites australis TaxID=29695 RepID=UPI002D76E16A|nr:uncharacterized protein LOC133883484 [Phragmites australis]
MALCANPDRVAIQAKLSEFDAQGLVDRLGHRSPGTIETPGVDAASGEEAASDPAQTGGPGAASGKLQASSRAAASSSRRTEGGGTAGSRAATALEDRGKHPRLFIPVESPPTPLPGEGGSRDDQSSSAGPSAGAASAVLEPHFGLLGPDSAPGDDAAGPQSSRRKRRREDSGPTPSSPEFRILAARWQYRRPTATPPTGAAENQGRLEASRPAPAREPSAPEPSASAEPGLASAATKPGLAGAMEPGPADAAAETETQPPPERSAPSEPAPSALSAGRLTAAWRVFDYRLAAARAANEGEQHAMDKGRKALEEARAEVTRERKTLEDARAELAREREDAARLAEASWQQAAGALARERQAQEREEAAVNRERAGEALQADLARQKDDVTS